MTEPRSAGPAGWNRAAESAGLRQSWERFTPEELDTYLVADVEDPRINAQSILTRALVADTLWPGRFDALIDEELRFGAVLTWIVRELGRGAAPELLFGAIAAGSDAVPRFVRDAWSRLEDPAHPEVNYIADALTSPRNPDARTPLPESSLTLFENVWAHELTGLDAGPGPARVSLVEAACGSANDYRFFERFGLARFVDYTGFDLSAKNIANARRRHPRTRFVVADAFETGFADRAFEFSVVHDLFEHLSPHGLEAALAEILRISSRQAWLHFFNLGDIPDHEFRPVDSYHWNLLSRDRIVGFLAPRAAEVEVVRTADLLADRFGVEDYHNQEAATMIVTLA